MHPFKQRWGFLPCKALPTSVGSFWGWVAPFCPNVTYMRLLENSNHAAIFQPLACILILSKCASVFKMFLIEVRNNSACFRFNIFESSVQAGKIPRHNFFFSDSGVAVANFEADTSHFLSVFAYVLQCSRACGATWKDASEWQRAFDCNELPQ